MMEKCLFNSKTKTHKRREISLVNERENSNLTLRKNKNMQKYLSHILSNVDDTFEYELSEKDFSDCNCTSMYDNNNTIIQHYENNTSFALWLFNVRKTLSEKPNTTSSYSIIKNMTQDQVNVLVDIVLIHPQNSKLKYESCWVLINLVTETNAFNDYFLLRIKEIYNYLFTLLNQDSPTSMCFILIRHIQWFLANLIQEKEVCAKIRQEVNIPLLIQAVFAYAKQHYINDTSPFNSQTCLIGEITLQMLDFFLLNTDKKLMFQYKSFIMNILECMKEAYRTNNNNLMKESLEPLYNYTLSLECLELLANNSEIIEILINNFEAYETDQVILVNVIKNSTTAVNIINTHDIVNRIILLVLKGSQNLNKVSYSNKIIVNTIKLLNAIISYDSFIFFIEKMVNDTQFLGMIPNIYHYYDIEARFQLFAMYNKFFTKGGNNIQNTLIKVNLHLFGIQELKSIIDNEANENHTEIKVKLITIILELLESCLSLGEKDKVNYIRVALENENIIDVLEKLQYNKHESIYGKANGLLVEYWNENNNDYNYDEDYTNNSY